jgi:hypothetical protein
MTSEEIQLVEIDGFLLPRDGAETTLVRLATKPPGTRMTPCQPVHYGSWNDI